MSKIMSEILFRGMAEGGKWVYGDLLHLGRTHIGVNFNGSYEKRQINPETVSQYTGRKDIYGKMIFGGDTVRDDEKFHYDVYWCEKHLAWMIDGECLCDFSEIGLEIIGNIHEDQLKEKGDEETPT